MKYNLQLKKEFDNYYDFNIIYENQIIGIFQTVVHNDFIFIRNIRMEEQFQRQYHATNFLKEYMNYTNKKIKLCVATSSDKAVKFWDNFLKSNDHINIRGNIYQLN